MELFHLKTSVAILDITGPLMHRLTGAQARGLRPTRVLTRHEVSWLVVALTPTGMSSSYEMLCPIYSILEGWYEAMHLSLIMSQNAFFHNSKL